MMPASVSARRGTVHQNRSSTMPLVVAKACARILTHDATVGSPLTTTPVGAGAAEHVGKMRFSIRDIAGVKGNRSPTHQPEAILLLQPEATLLLQPPGTSFLQRPNLQTPAEFAHCYAQQAIANARTCITRLAGTSRNITSLVYPFICTNLVCTLVLFTP